MNILGCPLKISATKQIYFPRLYIQHFGISPDKSVTVIRENHKDYFVYRIDVGHDLHENETRVVIRNGFTTIPTKFIRSNGLEPGKDNLFLLGIENGLKVSVKKDML
ncbi:hypothetical protein [Clostridium sp. KNHs216]|uniref:hypothetical protein n=1 Tax=Eubacteriales TaxID=186802 RepID=UPI00114E25E0|nr:hypothetical protein [Clostridium sp. KNHs216]TQI66283.1 hypothetical protein LY85_0944 [Clostridium sp. KNHs216]